MATPVCRLFLALVPLALLGAAPAGASDYELLDLQLQARVGERTLLGKQSPESFYAYDLRGTFGTPLEHRFDPGLTVGARLLGSVGLFEGTGRTALSASVVPMLAIGTHDGRFRVDGGLGLGVLSEHRYGAQDFGGPLQFALTAGLEAPLYGRLGLSYRFMHYSDAGAYGSDTIGADLHMAGLSYRF